MKKYSRVSYVDRCQICAMLKSNFSVPAIASQLGFNKSTIYRELNRNSKSSASKLEYIPNLAQEKMLRRQKSQGRKLKIQGDLENQIIKKLKIGWSPDAIAGRYKLEKFAKISHQSIYNYIDQNPEVRKFLKYSRKSHCGRLKHRRARERDLTPISKRPISAKNRSRFGHWERDGLYGANRKQLLVCLERKSRFIRLAKMFDVNAAKVSKTTEQMLRIEKVLSITNDNGTEFRRPQTCKHPIYYCDPLKPHQRGSVEHVVSMLRRFIKRTTDLEAMSNKDIKRIEDRINNTPRKLFNYKTAFEVYYGSSVALVF